MAFLTLYEMLPLALEYAGRKDAVKSVFVGMAFMSMRCVTLFACDTKNVHNIVIQHVV
jgi:zinc transporter ZupT